VLLLFIGRSTRTILIASAISYLIGLVLLALVFVESVGAESSSGGFITDPIALDQALQGTFIEAVVGRATALPEALLVQIVINWFPSLEVTGQAPITSLTALPEIFPSIRVGLRRDRPELDERITRRIGLMWEQGLVDEVRDLEAKGLREGVTARKALGYAQVLSAFDGEFTIEEAPERTMIATRQFARRQDSWFGRDSSILWHDANLLTAKDVVALQA
jgi:tRNA dimethylallyltransferase